MTTTIIRPNGLSVDSAGWVNVGGASKQASTSDSSDATYIADTGASPGTIIFALGTFTLPTGAVIKRVQPFVRCAQTGTPYLAIYAQAMWQNYDGRGGLLQYLTPTTRIVPTGLAVTTTCAAGGPLLAQTAVRKVGGQYVPATTYSPQDQLDGLTIVVTSTGTYTHRVYDVWLEVEYDEAPVCTGLALNPADALTRSSRPPLVWGYSDPENDPYSGFKAVIWATADVADSTFPTANPFVASFVRAAGTTATALSGSHVNDDGTANPNGFIVYTTLLKTWTPTADIAQSTPATAYVAVADVPYSGAPIRFGSAATLAFTVNVLLPPAPQAGDISATWDPTHWRTALLCQTHMNLLASSEDTSFENNTGFWLGTGNNCTVARDTSQHLSGAASLKLTAIAAGDFFADSSPGYPAGQAVASPGQVVVGAVQIKSAVARQVRLDIEWYTSTNAGMGSTIGALVTSSTSAWTRISTSATAPSLAAFASIAVKVVAPAAGENHWIDEAGLWFGSVAPTWSRGGFTKASTLVVERSTDSGATWAQTPLGQVNIPVGTGLVSTYDTGNPPNVAAIYRFTINAIDDLGFASHSVPSPSTSPVTAVFNQWVLRDPASAVGEVALPLTGHLDWDQAEAAGVFRELGATYPTFVSDALTSRVWHGVVFFRTEVDFQAFKALRALRSVLLLQTDRSEFYWVRPDLATKYSNVNNPQRRGATSAYQVALDLVEAAAPGTLAQGGS
jgi:hypothetical protein